MESRRGAILGGAAALVVVVFGVFVRVWLLGRQPWDTSTAIPALMAHEILAGHFFTFYWGQPYGGGEPYVVAAVFAVFGQSSFTLGLAPILLDTIATLILWRLGRRLFGPTVGAGAALLFWIWPEVYVFDSTQEYGFRYLVLVCGLAALLLAVRIAQHDEPATGPGDRPAVPAAVVVLEWLGLGLVAGVGWWASPEIMYGLLPALALLGWRAARRRLAVRPVRLGLLAAGAVVGALPWLYDNVGTGLGSLRDVPPQPQPSYQTHLADAFGHVVPTALGIRPRSNYIDATGSWAPTGWLGRSQLADDLGIALYVVVAVLLLVWMAILIRRRQAVVVVGATVLFPFLFALSPYAWHWHDGRYGLELSPLLALLIVSGADTALRGVGRPGWAVPLVVTAGVVLTVSAAAQLAPYAPDHSYPGLAGWLSWSTDPNAAVTGLARGLEADHVNYVFADSWLSWGLDWLAPGFGVHASDPRANLYGPYYEAVADYPDPAWLFVAPGRAVAAGLAVDVIPADLDPACINGTSGSCIGAPSFERYLSGLGIPYRVDTVDDFLVVLPSRPVPAVTLARLRALEPAGTALVANRP